MSGKAGVARFARWLGVRVLEGVTIRVVAGVVVFFFVAVAAVLALWNLSLVTEGIGADRLVDPDGRAWFQVWLLSVAGRVLALTIATAALAVWLWAWMNRIADSIVFKKEEVPDGET